MSIAKGASRGRIPPRQRSSARKSAQAPGIGALERGDLGEVVFVHKAMSLGFVVAKPYGHNHPYDFFVEGGRNLWRVQVKTKDVQLRAQWIVHSGRLPFPERRASPLH
jgi:PD-(D/E)XK endonuclease